MLFLELYMYADKFENIFQSPSLTGLQQLLCTHISSFVSKNESNQIYFIGVPELNMHLKTEISTHLQ